MDRNTFPGTNPHACTSMLADDIADRIAIAFPGELDGIIKDMWVDHTHGLLADNEMETLDEAARARREAIQERRQAARLSSRGAWSAQQVSRVLKRIARLDASAASSRKT